jgi:hypothetical protein
MGLRELKEAAHQQYVRGKFAECVKTYRKVLKLAPRDPNMHVRHAEACRRAGERQQAIYSYREAANLLLELGCETRARGALKAALELDPHDLVLQDDIARLTPQALAHEEAAALEVQERGELPMLPPLDSDAEPTQPFLPMPPPGTTTDPGFSRQQALPPIQRALPAVPSVPPVVPPVVLPSPGMRAAAPAGPRTLPPISRTRPAMAAPALPAREGPPPLPPRSATRGFQPPAFRAGDAGHAPPVLQPVGTATAAPVPAMASAQASAARPMTPPPLAPRSATGGFQAPVLAASPRGPAQVTGEALVPPPPPAEALKGTGAPAPAARARMEVRRVSPNALAFRGSPNDGWALIRSRTPLEVHLVEDLENLPAELRDFSLDITVEPPGESASSAVH